jgi:hypothetical protein
MNNRKKSLIVSFCFFLSFVASAQSQPCTYSVHHNSRFAKESLLDPDPDGDVVGHSHRTSNGSCSYLIQGTDPSSLILKIRKPSGETKTLGKLIQPVKNGQLTFSSSSGESINGQLAVPLSNGVAILRNDSMFIFEDGQNVVSFKTPSGWAPYRLQMGDVIGTKIVMLVKTDDNRGTLGFGGTEGANLSKVAPDARLRFAFYDYAKRVIVHEFISRGRAKNEYVLLANIPSPPYSKPHPIALSPLDLGIMSPADWIKLGDKNLAIFFDDGYTQVWVRDLTGGKSKKIDENPLGFLSFRLVEDNKKNYLVILDKRIVVKSLSEFVNE